MRNAGATFKRCMQKCLLKQLGWNAHVYVDDVVVKTEKQGTLLEDLKETFENLRRFQIKLNPEKCVFRVPAGQLLGFLVSERGIECNPVKSRPLKGWRYPANCWMYKSSPAVWRPSADSSVGWARRLFPCTNS